MEKKIAYKSKKLHFFMENFIKTLREKGISAKEAMGKLKGPVG